ncbi:MAG TPA: thioredoxin domain-containing protein [Vicinamibacterales bacterium]|nr:thioredoxin domain-containing protein [Vicinamibacterales bacterium]
MSLFVLKTDCVLCMSTYVCTIGIFVTSGLQTKSDFSRLPMKLLDDLRTAVFRPVFLIVAILYIAGAAAAVAFFPREGAQQASAPPPVSKDIRQAFADAWAQQPRVDLGIPAEGAKVLVVKFNDWLCPACKAAAQFYQPVLDKYRKESPGAVKYVVKDWPWNASCNFHVATTFRGHQGSCAAAAAVRMAIDRGKGDSIIDWLFANQPHLTELGLAGGSAAADAIQAQGQQMLGVTDWNGEYARKVVDIRRDVADGGALKVQSTPTFFVNGVRAADGNGNFLPPQYCDLAIKLEIGKTERK